MLTKYISAFFENLGAEWVLWLLLGLSVLSLGVIFERFLFFHRNAVDEGALNDRLLKALRSGGEPEARKVADGVPGMVGGVLMAALNAYDDGVAAVEEVISASITRERTRYNRFLSILGTLGNNAPFIGLFGTVIGIINAFGTLAGALEGSGRTQEVMSSISEALVATAVGLAVAIPAVIAFNSFKAQIRGTAANTEWLARNMLAYLKADRHDDGPRGDGGAHADGES